VLVWVFASVDDIQFSNKVNNRTMALKIKAKHASGNPNVKW
jgi:hypothetical protein